MRLVEGLGIDPLLWNWRPCASPLHTQTQLLRTPHIAWISTAEANNGDALRVLVVNAIQGMLSTWRMLTTRVPID